MGEQAEKIREIGRVYEGLLGFRKVWQDQRALCGLQGGLQGTRGYF